MNMKTAIAKAKVAVGNDCSVAPHYGATRKDRAVRITGCDARAAASVGPKIAEATGGTFVQAAGFAAVWL